MRPPVVIAYVDRLPSALRRFFVVVRGLAFWTAILLPMLYLPPLLLGHPTIVDPPVLGTLLGVNVGAIVVGHGHGRTTPDELDDRT